MVVHGQYLGAAILHCGCERAIGKLPRFFLFIGPVCTGIWDPGLGAVKHLQDIPHTLRVS